MWEQQIALVLDGLDIYKEGVDVKADVIADLGDLIERIANASVESALDQAYIASTAP